LNNKVIESRIVILMDDDIHIKKHTANENTEKQATKREFISSST